jgi:hypothetical protein
MGSYSVLSVGQVVLQWKYRVPPFLSFLFEEQDFYSDIREELDPYEEDERRVGYVTTASSAIRRLDDAGFTLAFFAGTYQLLDDEIDAWVLHIVGERLAEERGYPEDTSMTDDLAAEHVRSFRRGTALDDIHKFIGVLRESLSAGAHPAILRLSLRVGQAARRSRSTWKNCRTTSTRTHCSSILASYASDSFSASLRSRTTRRWCGCCSSDCCWRPHHPTLRFI